MVLYLSIVLIAMAIIATCNILFNPMVANFSPVWTILVVILAVVLEIVINLAAEGIIHIMPDKWFDENSHFKTGDKERKFYDKIRIKKWKDKVWELGAVGGFSKKKMYFNAGILIMNLKELRNSGFEDKFVDLLNKIKFTVAQDQDYLNVICKDKVHYLPLRWNRTPFGKCSDDEDNGIVHFFLSYKPWHYDNVPFEKQFWALTREAGFFDKILAMKCRYTDKDKQKDAEGYERLKKTALDQANSLNPFCKMEFAEVTI